ncbi:MAG: ferredoxin [Candidatus Korarchaeum sp.]|nr:ferredoxin [Candidatus Korarchaeum sp.]MDW8034897.1 ferredoxin [Candidatus Korarchaeum sp.]
MPIRVKVDRALCIGCGVAPALCPEVFYLEDGKNRIKPEFSIETSEEISVGEVKDELKDCVETAASSCPVSAITLE